MEIKFLHLTLIVFLLLGAYIYVKRRTPRRTRANFTADQQTHPAFEATQYFQVTSRPESFLMVLDPLAPRNLKNGKHGVKFLIFSSDEAGNHLVIVSDAKRHHSSLLHNPLAQGLTPLFAYIVHPAQKTNRRQEPITLPAGKSISTELFEESKNNLSWFTRNILQREDFIAFLS